MLNKEYNKVRRNLKNAIKTAEKYSANTVSIPDRPKRITKGSINRLQKLLEKQKKINKVIPKNLTVTLKYYYKDKKGKTHLLATEEVKTNKPERFKTKRVNIKNIGEFVNRVKMEQLEDKLGRIGDFLYKRIHPGLGEGSEREEYQQARAAIYKNYLDFVQMDTHDMPEEGRRKVEEIVDIIAKIENYYHTKEALEKLEDQLEKKIAELDVILNKKNDYKSRYINQQSQITSNTLDRIMQQRDNYSK